MTRIFILSMAVLLTVLAGESESRDRSCYPITAADLIQQRAPKFNKFPAQVETIIHAAPVSMTSHRLARTYRTVLGEGAAGGPNFAGHYTVVGWGCGSSCLQFAIVNARTGRVIFPTTFSTVHGVRLDADGFEPDTQSQYWGLRYRIDSRLLIAVGMLDENEKREGVFYFVMDNNKLKSIYTVTVKKSYCHLPGNE